MLLALVVFAIGFVAWWMYRVEDNPLDQLPGPSKWPILGNALEVMKISPKDLFSKFVEYPQKYGDRFVLKIFQLRVVNISNPKDIEIVLSHSRNIKKSKPYQFLESWLGTGLLLSTGSLWHRRRKILTPTFHFNILKNFSRVIEEKSRDLVGRLKLTQGADVNVLPMISDYTLYTICETALGTKLDSGRSAAIVNYKSCIAEIGSLLLNRLAQFWMHSDIVFRNIPTGKRFYQCLETVSAFADKVILEKMEKRAQIKENITAAMESSGTKARLAMLDLLLDAESKGEIDLDGIRDEVYTFMFEGHDTTAVGLTFALMLLADHEDVQDLIYEECQRIFGDSDRTPTMADFSEMKFLEAVIKETLRLYPSAPFIGRDIEEDFQMGDVLVKKGSEVSILIYALHHREDLFPDPEEFRPDRFLYGEIKHPYGYLPFSAGPRNCIGQKFAMLEMKSALSEICRNFRLWGRQGRAGRRPRLESDMVLRPGEPVTVQFLPRKQHVGNPLSSNLE